MLPEFGHLVILPPVVERLGPACLDCVMGSRAIGLSDELAEYILAHATSPGSVQQRLIDETQQMPGAGMQISADQGEFFTILTSLIRPRFVVEVGTFTGYSALAIAKGLGPGGRILCCDVSEEWTSVARRHWEHAGVADRIEIWDTETWETIAAEADDFYADIEEVLSGDGI